MIIIPSNIKNIIFDLGGVILDIDPEKTYKAFGRLGFSNPGHNMIDGDFKSFLFDFETGKISKEDFPARISAFSEKDPGTQDLYNAWNAMITGYSKEKIKFLKEIKSVYRTFLLSNTNSIHAVYYNNLLKINHKVNNLTDLFEKVYYSHKIKLRKPDPGTFRLVLEENHLIPGETLFVDDMEKNVEAARKLGIIGLVYKQ